tara:strand:+ start:328 stop:513 length:186 start_codon:yes stop_codon:yes gene_type:complete
VPTNVLLSTGFIEARCGKTIWPWSLNVQGKPERLQSHRAALKTLRAHQRKGTKNIYVGWAR